MGEKFLMDAAVAANHIEKIEKYKEKWDEISNKAEALVVDSEASKMQANDMLAQSKKLGKMIEDRRVEVYDELYPKASRGIMKKVNAAAKTIKEALVGIERSIEVKYLAYDRKVREEAALAEAKRIEDERKAREESQKAAAHLPPGMEPAPVVIESTPAVVKPVENMTSSGLGSTYKKKIKSFKVVDFSLVPDDFKILDESLVRKIMHHPDRGAIPGIVWTTEEKLSTKVR